MQRAQSEHCQYDIRLLRANAWQRSRPTGWCCGQTRNARQRPTHLPRYGKSRPNAPCNAQTFKYHEYCLLTSSQRSQSCERQPSINGGKPSSLNMTTLRLRGSSSASVSPPAYTEGGRCAQTHSNLSIRRRHAHHTCRMPCGRAAPHVQHRMAWVYLRPGIRLVLRRV